jgi:hypothetical protein
MRIAGPFGWGRPLVRVQMLSVWVVRGAAEGRRGLSGGLGLGLASRSIGHGAYVYQTMPCCDDELKGTRAPII